MNVPNSLGSDKGGGAIPRGPSAPGREGASNAEPGHPSLSAWQRCANLAPSLGARLTSAGPLPLTGADDPFAAVGGRPSRRPWRRAP